MRRSRRWLAALALALTAAPEGSVGQEPPGTYADAPFNQGTIFYNSSRAWSRRQASNRFRPRGSYGTYRRADRRAYVAPRATWGYAAPGSSMQGRQQWYWTGRGWQLR